MTIAMNPKLKIPVSTSATNHALLSSCQVFEYGADPRDEAGDDSAGCREAAEERDAEEHPRECAALDGRDIVAVHDEYIVRDRERDSEDRDDCASPESDQAADEDARDCGLEHRCPFLMCSVVLV